MNRYKSKISFKILILVLLCIFTLLCFQINTFYVPNSDFLNYLNIGNRVLVNPLDPHITSAPLYSVLVYLLEIILPIKYPGIIGGVVLNIICFIITLFFLWLLSERWMGKYAILPVLFFGMNPVVSSVILQPSNIPLALMLIVMALHKYMLNPAFSYLLVFIASLTRIESIPLLFVFITSDMLFYKRVRCPKVIIIAFLCVLAWYVRPVVPHDNYIDEMKFRRNEIPNVAFIRNSFIRAPFSLDMLNAHKTFNLYSYESISLLIVLLWIILGMRRYYLQNSIQSFVIIGYIVGYTGIHFLFPDRVLRYSYPLLPFMYLLVCWPVIFLRKTHSLLTRRMAIICIGMISLSILGFAEVNRSFYLNDQKWDRAERRLVSEWLNVNVKKPTTVYAFEPYVFSYYIDNKMINLKDSTKLSAWNHDLCSEKNEIYIVFDNQTAGPGEYFDKLNGISYFLQLSKTKGAMNNMKRIKHIGLGKRYADVYTFIDKPTGEWCKQIFHE